MHSVHVNMGINVYNIAYRRVQFEIKSCFLLLVTYKHEYDSILSPASLNNQVQREHCTIDCSRTAVYALIFSAGKLREAHFSQLAQHTQTQCIEMQASIHCCDDDARYLYVIFFQYI